VFFCAKGVERRKFEIAPADFGRDRGTGTGMKSRHRVMAHSELFFNSTKPRVYSVFDYDLR